MPNRDLKESNRRSPSLQLLSDAAERLWYRLLTAVDDFGRMEADPEVVFTTCFQRVPNGWTIDKVKKCLFELSSKAPKGDRPLIVIYEVGMRSFIQILSASSHIYRRAKESKYPTPTDTQLSQQVTGAVSHLRASARTCTQIPSVPESRIPSPDPRTSEADAASRFQSFWQAYPSRNGRKVEKSATEAVFLLLPDEDQALAVQAARNYADALNVDGLNPKDPKRFIRDGNGYAPWTDWVKPITATAKGPPSPIPKSFNKIDTVRKPHEPIPDNFRDLIEQAGKGKAMVGA
jgi:hypothetical protein